MAILNRLLRLLKLLEQMVEFADYLTTPVGITLVFCLLSYQSLLLLQCDAPSAALLASVVALTLHCTLNRPDF
jgi:hypothetical protein